MWCLDLVVKILVVLMFCGFLFGVGSGLCLFEFDFDFQGLRLELLFLDWDSFWVLYLDFVVFALNMGVCQNGSLLSLLV